MSEALTCWLCGGRRIRRVDAFLHRCLDCDTPWPKPPTPEEMEQRIREMCKEAVDRLYGKDGGPLL